jgi:hypothetical protein
MLEAAFSNPLQNQYLKTRHKRLTVTIFKVTGSLRKASSSIPPNKNKICWDDETWSTPAPDNADAGISIQVPFQLAQAAQNILYQKKTIDRAVYLERVYSAELASFGF